MDNNQTPDKSLELQRTLTGILRRRHIPGNDIYLEKVEKVLLILENEIKEIRPRDSLHRPGGLIYLKRHLPTVIIPDLHARMDFFLSIMMHRLETDKTILNLLCAGKIQVVCVGDGFHAERRAAQRWRYALAEYRGFYKKHRNIDEEMKESLGLMEMVMEIKTAFPDHFHFLKGNHENITNENGNGNRPFGKFAFEGEMVKVYMLKFYSEKLIQMYYKFERALPLLVIGKNFIISHAEPRIFHSENPVIDYRMHPEVVYDLTWTADNAAETDSVSRMLSYYLDNSEDGQQYYFGGHRPVKDLYNLRADGKYVQIHNPDKFIIAYIKTDKPIEPEKDIFEIEKYKL